MHLRAFELAEHSSCADGPYIELEASSRVLLQDTSRRNNLYLEYCVVEGNGASRTHLKACQGLVVISCFGGCVCVSCTTLLLRGGVQEVVSCLLLLCLELG